MISAKDEDEMAELLAQQMTREDPSTEEELRYVEERIVSMSDEELLAEAKAEGIDAELEAQRLRSLMLAAIEKVKAGRQ